MARSTTRTSTSTSATSTTNSTSTTSATRTASRPGDLDAATEAVLGEGARLREEQQRALAALADAGHLRPVRDATFDLADVAAAHAHVDAGKKGSVVLDVVATEPPTTTATDRAAGAAGSELATREATP